MYNHRPVCMCVYTGEKNYLKQTSETVELKPKVSDIIMWGDLSDFFVGKMYILL